MNKIRPRTARPGRVSRVLTRVKKLGSRSLQVVRNAMSSVDLNHFQSPISLTNGSLLVYGNTNVGCVRTNNEDSLLIMPLDSGSALLALADGVGGQNCGEVASGIACQTIAGYVEEGVFNGITNNSDSCTGILTVITHEAHRAIAINARDNTQRRGMACTLTLAMVTPTTVIFNQVGDSRLYLLARGALSQKTRDQTITNALLDDGRITAEQARDHSRRNVLEHALGLESDDHPLVPGKGRFDFNPGDQLMLCSHGLSDFVDDECIEKIMQNSSDPHECVQRLIDEALQAGGRDNVTVINLRR